MRNMLQLYNYEKNRRVKRFIELQTTRKIDSRFPATNPSVRAIRLLRRTALFKNVTLD
jgi:hypothetical protein